MKPEEQAEIILWDWLKTKWGCRFWEKQAEKFGGIWFA